MRNYEIFTDSCADLSAQEAAGITVLPLRYTLDGVNYLDTPDRAALPMETLYARLRQGAVCRTAGVSVSAFSDAMTAALEAGHDVLCICFSGALSSTFQFACSAAQSLRERYPDSRVEVIDSLSVTRGQGMLVLGAAEQRRQGKSLDEAAAWARAMIPRLSQWFIVDDLSFLRRGGRLNAAGAIFGSMLSIKPMLHADEGGLLTPVGKIRGRLHALDALVNRVERLGDRPLEKLTVFLSHADCPESAEYVAEQLRSRLGVTDVRADYLGPVTGSHAGPGTLYLAFCGSGR